MKLAARLREWGVAHPAASSWLALVAVWTIAGVVFYWRFPNNLQYPNFYAEDGSVLTEGLLHHGFWGAVLALFNGYCIAGMYLLAQIGFWLNGLLYHGQLADLPKAYALVSYGFLGLVAALPVVLLRAYIGLGWRLLVALAVTVLPITNYDYAIIGVIGNFKYLFVPVAFMLVMYRIRLPRTSKRIWLADLGLLICLYTDAAVYLLLPALLLGDGLRPRQLLGLRGLPRRDNVALWSAVVLGVLSLYQIYLVGRYGIPAIPGYLDEPLRTSPLLEIGVARSYLYPLVYWWYKHLNDVVSVGMLGLIVAAMWRWGRREHWAVYGVGLAIIAVATGLFVANRTGVTALFNNYVSPGPDQFFFGQNIVFMVLVVLLAADVASRLARRWRWVVGALLALVLIAPVGEVGSWGYHNFMQHDVGTIKAQAKVACATQTTPGDSVLVGVYPSIDLHVRLPRAQLCTAEVAAYQPDYVTFGLQPGTDPYLGLNSPMTVQQVFVAPRDGLAGVSVYLSTFMRHWTSPYRLTLYREDCRTVVRQTDLPPLISDNRYLDVHFAPVTDSASRRYCFDLKPTTIPADALAAWMTPPDSYPAGQLLLNGQPDPRTLVFSLLYPNVN